MLLLLFACAGISFLLHWFIISRPARISGTVVDWTTGLPVPAVMVRLRELNGSSKAATTDARGRFTATVPRPTSWVYWLYAEDPRFGSLLQSTFGRALAVHALGERHSGIVVPAIRATGLSGHVYAEDSSTPLPGCEVWAMIEQPDQAPQFQHVSMETTDKKGAFRFARLGADRYFVLARCHRYLPGEQRGYADVAPAPWKSRSSWEPMLYPQAASFDHAKAIVLLPGDDRRGIDFQLRSVPQYSLYGNVNAIFSDRSRGMPWPAIAHLSDLQAFPADPALAAIAPYGEACDWNARAGDFHCDFLSASLYF